MTDPKKEAGGVKVTFARPWTIDGTDYKADQSVTLPHEQASEVLFYGYARKADTETKG